MASAKVRNSLLIALVSLLAISAGLVAIWQFMGQSPGASDLQGYWEGSVSVRTMTVRLVLKVDKAPDGTYTATVDSIDQGARDIPVNTITLSNRTVQFQLAALRARYEGKLDSRGTELSGEWQQGGTKVPVTFKRTATPSSIAPPLPASAYARREDSPLQGIWKATLEVGVPVRIVVRISETSPGKFSGTMDSPDQGSRNIPLTSAEYSKPLARFDIAGLDGHFEGTLKDDGSEIDGTWTQGPNNIPCLLTRADPAEDAAPDENAYVFSSDAELQGIWNGTLSAGGSRLRLVLKIARATNATYTAALDSPDQGSKDIQAAAVNFDAPQVMVEWPALRALFHGEIKEGRLVGFWQQGANDFPIRFERTNRVASANTSGKK
jgi:hypothetical protein